MDNIFNHRFVLAARAYAKAHRFITSLLVLLLAWGIYVGYGKLTSTADETKYVTAQVQKGTLIVSLSGSGQVSAQNQIDVKSKASGDVAYVGVANGQTVKAGALIAQLDARDAQKSVRDAEANLESAQISLQKLVEPADELAIAQSENTLLRAQQTKQNAQTDLASAYDDGFNRMTNAFLDLPSVMTGLHDVLFTSLAQLGGVNVQNIDFYKSVAGLYSERADTYRADAYDKYQIALTKYNKNFEDYKSTSRTGDPETVEAIVVQTYDTAKALADAVKSANNLIQFYEDQLTQHNLKYLPYADTQLATLNGFTAKTNTHLSSLLSAQSTIKNDKDTIANADRTIAENTLSLAKLKAGPNALDISSSQLSVKQRQNALQDAREKLADYYIRAPFDGTIAKVSVKTTDTVSGGTAVATLVTKQKIATISLNEVDVAKVKIGQKTTLTFDAVEGLTISGEVAEIDTVGTITQGVVTYNVQIRFDTQDERVKPGMSVSAAIITLVKQDVLLVPNSAVKSRGGDTHYVEVFDTPIVGPNPSQGVVSAIPPREQGVEIGSSNDTSTEIISGLSGGEQVITRTIAPSTTQTTPAPSLFGGGGARGVRL